MKLLGDDFKAPASADSRAAAAEDDPSAKSPRLPKGLVLGGECPDPGPNAAAEIVQQASALIPVKEGMTLSNIWVQAGREFEFECLTQVTAVKEREVEVTLSCPEGRNHALDTSARRICRTDLRDAYMYYPSGSSTSPEVIGGSTMFSLSQNRFRQLKSGRGARHRWVELVPDWKGKAQPLLADTDGMFAGRPPETLPFNLIVNDRVVQLPALRSRAQQVDGPTVMIATVLDDERFPFMLQYDVPDSRFSLRYTKVSYPTVGELEKRLAVDKHVDVYGIYFDFASDRIRTESEPVLREIAKAMTDHLDWALDLDGHTDNIGGVDRNLDLSKRRAAAVKQALVSRYRIAAPRLITNGYGASRPKENNDTIEGRARNRRVELTRR